MSEPNPSLSSNANIAGPFQISSLMRTGWIYPLLAFAFLLLLLASKKIGSYDLGTHLRSGQWIVQNHSFPTKDTFTYTQNDRDYLDPYGLYQILLYGLQRIGGYSALNFMNIVVVFLTFGILFWRLKLSHASPGLATLLLFIGALAMERRFTVRPELFSWFFLSLTLLILELRLRGRDRLYLLPLLQLLWVNTEGLFVLGWFAMGAFFMGIKLQTKKWDSKLLQFSLFSLVADLLNPYFLKGVLFPFVLWTRLQGSNLHKQTIVELYSPWEYLKVQKSHYDTNLHVYLFFLLALLCFSFLALTFNRRKFQDLVLLAGFTYMAATAVRNIPLFTLVAIPLLAACVSDFLFQRKWNPFQSKWAVFVLGLAITLTAARVATNAFYIEDRRLDRLGWGLDPEILPVKAAEFLARHHLDGRLLNDLNTGGWLDWKAPQPTFIDGRSEVMGDDFYRQYHESFQGIGLSQLVAIYQPKLVLAQYNAAYPWVEQLKHLSGWRLIYLDESAGIWSAPDYAPEIQALSFTSLLSEKSITPGSEDSVFKQLQVVTPAKFAAWLEGFYSSRTYPMGLMSLGLFSLRSGEFATARDFFTEALRQAGGGYEEIYYNLGVASLRLGDRASGRRCLEDVLQLNPHDANSKQMLQVLGTS
ncbi:MAG TPA: hypothetical protein VMV05_01110 [bacterium]|nr:hypothetical protein [bacterium]